MGGTVSSLGGGKFKNGAVSGAFVHLFSNEMSAANDDAHAIDSMTDDELRESLKLSPKMAGNDDYSGWASPAGEVSMTTGGTLIGIGMRLPPNVGVPVSGVGVGLVIVGGGLKSYDVYQSSQILNTQSATMQRIDSLSNDIERLRVINEKR